MYKYISFSISMQVYNEINICVKLAGNILWVEKTVKNGDQSK